MTKGINKRIKETESGLTEDSRTIVARLEDLFTDYFKGNSGIKDPDMLRIIKTSPALPQQAKLILEYTDLRSTQALLPSAVEEFVSMFPKLKYSPNYTLCNFLLNWSSSKGEFNSETNRFGTYATILVALTNHLERRRELTDFFYDEDLEFLGDIESFTKLGLISIIATNEELISNIITEDIENSGDYIIFSPEFSKGQFLEKSDSINRIVHIAENIKERAKCIESGQTLAIEASSSFLNSFDRTNSQSKKDLEFFLDRFSAETESFNPKRIGGSYRPLLKRLKGKYSIDWKEHFIGLLPEPYKSRTRSLDKSYNKKGLIEEDIIKFAEKLTVEGLMPYVSQLGAESPELTDILIALSLGKLGPEEQKMLRQLTKKGKYSIGHYLGLCRMTPIQTDEQYDMRRCLSDICSKITPEHLASDEVISLILINKMRQIYEESFRANPQGTMASIGYEILNENNEIRKTLLEKTLSHYRLRERVSKVSGIVDSLVVVK